jgi:heme/copper-type cytochrome/quinol oxidase subunit 3
MMSDAVQPGWVAFQAEEPPDVQQGNNWIGARLLVSSTVFLFLPFVFGYLYLASLNTSGLWRPNHLKAPIGWGIAILLAVIVCAGLVAWGRSELAGGRDVWSRWLLAAALVVGVVTLVLQVIEYAVLNFGPTDGGFASVFVGWTGLYALVLLLTMVWLEVIVASTFRNGSQTPGSTPADVGDFGFYLTFLAGLGAVTFAFLYLF